MSHENLQLAELAAFYCRSDRQICGIERDQGSLYCMIQIRLAGPYGADQVVVCIQLMEPGAVYMIQNLFIQILTWNRTAEVLIASARVQCILS